VAVVQQLVELLLRPLARLLRTEVVKGFAASFNMSSTTLPKLSRVAGLTGGVVTFDGQESSNKPINWTLHGEGRVLMFGLAMPVLIS
jgi:hypothetical protein